AFPHGKMPQRVPPAWHSDMPLPGKLLLSAAALLLLSLAFRFYRNRSPPPGETPPGEQRENRDGDGEGELGNEPGSKLVTKPGNESGSEQANEPGIELGNKRGNKLGIKSGIELGGEQGSEPGSKLGTELGRKAGVEVGSEPGDKAEIELGSEPGALGGELGSHHRGAVAGGRSSPSEDAPAPSCGRPPGVCHGRTEGDGCAQSSEQDPAGAGRSGEGSAGTVRTLSVTSSLGLLLTASEARSDSSYCFSSVAKIQVEESFVPERRDKDRDNPPGPGLRGKVYDYFVQSTSESVSRPTSLPFVPAGTSPRHRERGQEEPQSSGTQGENPALGIPDPNTSAASQKGTENPPEPPSPGWNGSTVRITLQLPGGDPAAAPELSQALPPTQVHLGNCSEVLRSAKARQLRALRDTALRVMSEHLLQVLRSPHIYGRLNAGERELLPALRSRGRPRLVVADVPPAEPGHRRGRLCYYDEDGDRWWQLCQLPAGVAGPGCAVCSMFNYLFVVPGWEGQGRERSPSRRVLCYDPLGDSWHDICPLRQARPRCQLVALDGHLYAIGGECLASVERYDPRRDCWAFAAALPRDTFAVAHAATVCDGDIYVTGGTLRSLLLRYDARGDSWATSLAVGDQDRTAELVSAHGFLYRFQLRRGAGGTDVAVSRCSASARLWYRCASHPLPEPAGLRCAALGSLVHCLGRDFHLRFLADPVSPRFGAKELRPFPAPHGSLLPAVLVLPEVGAEPPRL
ncbi:KLD7A protein, partial [Phainopepla nitens]|nr:KLD7A protein [Phainopepla nitens]